MCIEHLDSHQLARRWRITEDTVIRWRVKGLGPPYLKIQGRILYRIEDVEAYEAESLRISPSERICIGKES